MIKKDILEIRRQFTHENCCISRICGCYVDAEKEKKLEFREAFLSLPEEDTFKYFELFKQSLSGTLGKNLLPMEFPLSQEAPGGTHDALIKLRDSKLTDDMLLDEFYDKVIEHYDYGENYLILLIHGTYDIPGRSTDGSEMFDASDDVYEHILVSICPVGLSKAGLCYNAEKNNIEHCIRDWLVQPPANAFLFPAFSERATDLHQVLYYSKKPNELMPEFIDELLGCHMPLTAADQKETFQAVVSDTLGDSLNLEVVTTIHEKLNEMIEEHKDDPEPLLLTKPDVKRLLAVSGAEEESLDSFETQYDTIAGEQTALAADHIAATRKFSIQTPDVVIQVNPDRTDLVETKIIDGRQYLVIAVDSQVEVNGMPVRLSE